MVGTPVSHSTSPVEPCAHKLHRMSLLSKLILRRRSSSSGPERQTCVTDDDPLRPQPTIAHAPVRRPSSLISSEPISDASIEREFAIVYQAIATHVHRFYTTSILDKSAHQSAIEHATTGLGISWRQFLPLLDDGETRLGTLTLCIAWTILSRSLLLKLGLSSIPGSTFLPPEIVECFQSFSVGKGAIVPGEDEKCCIDFALVSRWKQITARLLRETYVDGAFSYFDSRTLNIERGLNDLHSLLRAYSDTSSDATAARMADLRNVLKLGAGFAFTLFGTQNFWQFDWKGPRSDDTTEIGNQEWQPSIRVKEDITLAPRNLVIWPSLVKIMDTDGHFVGDQVGSRLGEKTYLDEFK